MAPATWARKLALRCGRPPRLVLVGPDPLGLGPDSRSRSSRGRSSRTRFPRPQSVLAPSLLASSALLGALACGGPRLENPSEPVEGNSASTPAEAPSDRPSDPPTNGTPRSLLPPERTGCQASPKVEHGGPDFRAVTRIGEFQGRTWVVAMAPSEPTNPADSDSDEAHAVLLHIDSALGLVRTPLPWWSEDIAVERGEKPALRMIDSDGARWLPIDLSEPRDPQVGPEVPIPGLVPGEYAKAVASDGERGLVSLYRRAPDGATPRYLGETFLLDVATGERVGAPAPATVWMASCASGRCYGLAELNDAPDQNKLVELGPDGLRVLAELGPWTCGGATEWHTAEEWRIARNGPGKVLLNAINLRTGAHRAETLELGGNTCTSVAHVSTPQGDGLIEGDGANARFFPIDGQLRPGKAQSLPTRPHREHEYVRAGDSVLAVDVEANTWMKHDSPGPDGEYEYNRYWSFAGQGGLLDPAPSGWRWRDSNPSALPHDGEDGELHDGYRPIVMSAPGQAAVLVIGGMSEPSDLVTYFGPC